MSNGALDPLYKDRKVTLWVEDLLTRDYLTAAWDDPPAIRLLVAGGSSPMAGLVAGARAEQHAFVFGLSDRDFGGTNHGRWSGSTAVFRLRMHEIENALLDPESICVAMRVLGKELRVEDVRQKLQVEAQGLVWGMALGSTLARLRGSLQEGFPTAGGLVEVADRNMALARIVQSAWWTSQVPALSGQLTTRNLEALLDEEHARYQLDLGSDAFLTTFAGKEMLGRVFAWVVQATSPASSATKGDLAKGIGNAQREAGRLPEEIAELRDVLLGVAG